jgi:hypothetical protein
MTTFNKPLKYVLLNQDNVKLTYIKHFIREEHSRISKSEVTKIHAFTTQTARFLLRGQRSKEDRQQMSTLPTVMENTKVDLLTTHHCKIKNPFPISPITNNFLMF